MAVADDLVADDGDGRGQRQHEQAGGERRVGGGHDDRRDDDHRRAGDSQRWNGSISRAERAVQRVEAQHVDGDRHRGRQHHGELADVRLVLDGEGGDVEPGTRRGEGGEQGDVPVAPAERAVAEAVEQLAARDHEVHPPHAERQPDAGEAHERGLDGPPLGAHDGVERGDRAEDHLAERDDRQQPVPLGDVVRVPRRATPKRRSATTGPASSTSTSTAATANITPIDVSATSSPIQPIWATISVVT